MDSLANDMLLQIQQQQVDNALVLGKIASGMESMVQAHAENKKDIEEVTVRVKSLEDKGLRTTGFLAGAQFVVTSLGVMLAKKFRWL